MRNTRNIRNNAQNTGPEALRELRVLRDCGRRTQPMTVSEKTIAETLDLWLEAARERPYASIGGRMAIINREDRQ